MAQPAKQQDARIAVSNQKGGVGKTMVAINVAGALNARGRDVLFVDLDPQGNATEGLGLQDAYEDKPPSLYEVLTEAKRRPVVNELIIEHGEMDVLPSNIDMTSIEPELTLARRGGEQLALVFDEIETAFDYIIVDCPPYLGNLTENALFATENVLIPALAESTSKRALELLFDHIGLLETDYEIVIDDLGVVANRVEETNEARDMMAWFERVFDDVPVWEVRKRVAFQRAFSEGVSIYEFDKELDMIDVFDAIAADLDRQFGFVEAIA